MGLMGRGNLPRKRETRLDDPKSDDSEERKRREARDRRNRAIDVVLAMSQLPARRTMRSSELGHSVLCVLP